VDNGHRNTLEINDKELLLCARRESFVHNPRALDEFERGAPDGPQVAVEVPDARKSTWPPYAAVHWGPLIKK
jgi:hypothetical protein